MSITRPQLPTSGEVFGALVGALRLRSLIASRVPERTLRRVLSDEAGIKPETRREVIDAVVTELFPDELLVTWGLVGPSGLAPAPSELRERFGDLTEEALHDWDRAAGVLRSTAIDTLNPLFALLPWVRLFAVELGLRVGAYFAIQGVEVVEEEDSGALVQGRAFDRLLQRYRRSAGGIPREDLARGGGVASSTVDEWLAGRALPQAENILSLAAVLASRVQGASEAELVFHLRWSVAASEAARWLWEVCPSHPSKAGLGPPRPAQFIIEFLAVLELAHGMAYTAPVPDEKLGVLWWTLVTYGSKCQAGKAIIAFTLDQARDSYLRADLDAVLRERWQERVLLLYRQIPSVEGASRDPFAKRLALTPDLMLKMVEMEAWGRVSPNPGGWHFEPAQSRMGFPNSDEEGEQLHMVVLNNQDFMSPTQRTSKLAMEAMHARGDEREALAHHQQLVAAEPANAKYHFWLGASLAAVGRIDEAVLECKIAAGLEPDWSLPAVEVAIILSNAGRGQEALAAMRDIEGKYEVDAHFANVFGYTHMYLSQFEEAIRWFRRTLSLNAEHARATMHLAHCLLMTGERIEGRSLAKRARMLGERWVYDGLKAGRYDGKR